jgi:ssDNA-binding Zn-finger/Zn-ribbon topoisomerase 1
MGEPPEINRAIPATAGELRFDCSRCGARIVAVRGRDGSVRFHAPPSDGDPHPEPIHACPRCKNALPSISWSALKEQVWQ